MNDDDSEAIPVEVFPPLDESFLSYPYDLGIQDSKKGAQRRKCRPNSYWRQNWNRFVVGYEVLTTMMRMLLVVTLVVVKVSEVVLEVVVHGHRPHS